MSEKKYDPLGAPLFGSRILEKLRDFQEAQIEKNKQRILKENLTQDQLAERLAEVHFFQTQADVAIEDECRKVLPSSMVDELNLLEDNNLRLVKILVAVIIRTLSKEHEKN